MERSSIFAFLGGALVGAAIAVLVTPQKGEDTRKQIKDFLDKEYEKGKEKVKEKFCHAQAEAE